MVEQAFLPVRVLLPLHSAHSQEWLCYENNPQIKIPSLPLQPISLLLRFLLRSQLLDHSYANRVDDPICILGMEIVVVSEDRKQ